MSTTPARDDIYAETLAVFDRVGGPAEPLSTPEVAAELDVSRRGIYKRMAVLVDRGELETKKVGAGARVWWRPVDDADEESTDEPPENGSKAAVETVDERELLPSAEVFDTAEVGVFVLETDDTIGWVDATAERYFGVDRRAIIGRPYPEVVRRRLAPIVSEPSAFVDAALAADEVAAGAERFEFRVQAQGDREVRWLERRRQPIESGRYAGGRVEVYYDVTERKERETELAQLERLVETVQDGVYAVDESARFVHLNEAICEMVGWEREALLGRPARTIHDDEITPHAEALAAEVAAGDRDDATIELELITKDGDRIPVESRLRPFPIGDGVGRCGVVRDVSNRVERERKLEESERRYRTLVENFPNGIVTLFDEELRYQIAGGALFETFGASADELVGQTIYERNTPEDIALLEPAYRAALAGEYCSFETEYGGRTIEIWTVPVKNEAGEVFAGMAMSQDVTERVANERELERQRGELQALAELYQAFQEVTDLALEPLSREEIEAGVCERLVNSTDYEFAWIGRLARDGRTINTTATSEADDDLIDLSIQLDEQGVQEAGPIARAARTRTIQLSADHPADPVYDRWAVDRDDGVRTVVVVPIAYDGRRYGVLALYTEQVDPIGGVERTIVEQLGEVIGHAITAIERERALLADRVVEVEYRSRTLAKPFVEAGDADVRISIDRTVPLADGGALQYYTLDGLEADEFVEIASELPSVTDIRVLLDGGEQSRVEVRSASETITSVLRTLGGRTTSTVIESDELRVVVELPETANIRAVTEAVRAHDPDLELVGLRHETRQPLSRREIATAFEDALTERQRAAFETAYTAGYFEWPRGVTAEQLAELHAVHPSTFHQHLRRAEAKLATAMLDARS